MKTASFEEQIMSKDKAIARAIVFIIFHLHIFFATVSLRYSIVLAGVYSIT